MNDARNPVARGIACAAIVLCCTSMVSSQCIMGSGRPDDPFQVATPEHLALLDSYRGCSRFHWVLVASIDLSNSVRSSPMTPYFWGSFDGRGYAIRGLTVRGSGWQGLFGRIMEEASVTNLQLEDVAVAGTDTVGGLAAINAGTVSNCHITGRVVGGGRDRGWIGSAPDGSGDVGGLVGVNTGTITDCSSAARVVGIQYVGGLVGINEGIIAGSSCAGDVSGKEGVGGLAGRNWGGVLRNCGSTSPVSGAYYIGGLVGVNEGRVWTSCSDSDVVGERALGGLVGSNEGVVSNCYSAGSVTGEGSMGGLAGVGAKGLYSCFSIATVTGDHVGGLVGEGAGYWAESGYCYFLAPDDGGGPDNKAGTPLTAAQMEQQSSFPFWDFWGSSADGNADFWFMPEGSSPVLSWQTEDTGLKLVPCVTGMTLERARAALVAAGFTLGNLSYDFHRTYGADLVIHANSSDIAPVGEPIDLVLSLGATYDWADNPGDGTAENPYQIQTAGQLESLTDHPELWDRRFVLTTDMNMAGRTYSMALIGSAASDSMTDSEITPFAGVFDGQGHIIRNLAVQANYRRQYAGLFGKVAETGRISGVHMVDAIAMITRNTPSRVGITAYIGVLAGYNDGTIDDCSTVRGLAISRLVGVNSGCMTNCCEDGIAVDEDEFYSRR